MLVSLCQSNSLPEKHLSLGIRQNGPPKPHIIRASTAIGHLNIIIQQDVSQHRFRLVGCKKSARAAVDMRIRLSRKTDMRTMHERHDQTIDSRDQARQVNTWSYHPLSYPSFQSGSHRKFQRRHNCPAHAYIRIEVRIMMKDLYRIDMYTPSRYGYHVTRRDCRPIRKDEVLHCHASHGSCRIVVKGRYSSDTRLDTYIQRVAIIASFL